MPDVAQLVAYAALLEPEPRPADHAPRHKAARNPDGESLRVTRMCDVEPEEVKWLWLGRVPSAKLVILDGDPGLGKSTVSLDFAARVTTAGPMPDGSPGLREPSAVVLLSAEDGLADTIRPRLGMAQANLGLVVAIGADAERLPVLPDDIPRIREIVERERAALVVIDPLMAYLDSSVNSWSDQDVRRALAPLSAMAQDTGATVLVIRHLNKARGGNPLYRGGGSIGIIGAARSGLLVAADPTDEGRRVLAVTKCNLGRPGPSLTFAVEDVGGVPRISWGESTGLTAAQLLAAPADDDEQGALHEAVEALREILAAGPVEARAVQRQAKQAGVSEATLRRAKQRLGVQAVRESGVGAARGEGRWVWQLQGVHPDADAHLDHLDHLEADPRDSGVVFTIPFEHLEAVEGDQDDQGDQGDQGVAADTDEHLERRRQPTAGDGCPQCEAPLHLSVLGEYLVCTVSGCGFRLGLGSPSVPFGQTEASAPGPASVPDEPLQDIS